jgi:hypothetical protein
MLVACDKCNRQRMIASEVSFQCACVDGAVVRALRQPDPAPGTELQDLLSQFGITEKTSCSCRGVRAKMDAWGIDGCEQPQNRQWIIEQLQANAAKYSWAETLSAAVGVIANPSQWLTALRLNPLSMAESLLDEALRRARAKQEAT